VNALVRMVEAEDLPRIAAGEAAADHLLIQQFGPSLFCGVTPGEARAADPGFMAVVGRPCIGFAQVLEEGRTAHLQQLAVDPTHGRRGVGRALVEACRDQARQREHVELTLATL